MAFFSDLQKSGRLLVVALFGFLPLAGIAQVPTCWTNVGFSLLQGQKIKLIDQPDKQANRVCFVQRRSIPIVDIRVDVAAGSAYDPKEKAGLASLTRQMMGKATTEYGEEALLEAFADSGAQYSGVTEWERSGFIIRSLSDKKSRNQAVHLLSSTLHRPDFSEAIFEREKKRVLAALDEAEKSPAARAGRAYYQAIYPDHPYGLSATIASVSNISTKDLAKFYSSYYQKGRATITIVGDVDIRDADSMASELLGISSEPRKMAPIFATAKNRDRLIIAPVPQLTESKTIRIDMPTKQVHILMGRPLMVKNDIDFFPIRVGNQIFGGGGLLSRLMQEVREERGLVYDIRSEAMTGVQPGPFTISLQVEASKAEEALTLTNNLYREFIAKGPTLDEIRRTKQFLVSLTPLQFESNRSILSIVSTIAFYNLPKTWIINYPKNIEKVTLPQVKETFIRRLSEQPMITVIVGQQQNGAN